MIQKLAHNLKKVLQDKISVWVGILTILIAWAIWRYFTNLDLTIGNMWVWFAYTEIVLYGSFTILFGIFVATSVHQWRYFSEVNGKTSGIWGIGGVFGMLVAWCPACSITLASYLGIASVMSFLPWKWMELKILGIFLLLYACWKTLNNLETCQLRSKEKQKVFILLPITSMNYDKIILTLVIVAWLATSAWAINDYIAVAPTVNAQEIVQQQPSVPTPTQDTYIPTSVPSGACNGWGWWWGWCGCWG